jgi:hypothetical protein
MQPPARAAVLEMGRPGVVSPGSVQIWPVPNFFSEKIVRLFPQACNLEKSIEN